MQITTATDIKQSNKMKILRFIRFREKVTQPEIVKALKISRPTVSTLVEDLIGEGYVQIQGIGASTAHGGKRPKLLSFNHQSKGIISLHINSAVIDGALLDLSANIIFRVKVKVKPERGSEQIIDEIFTVISELYKKASEVNIPVQGIGVGSPGLIETKLGTILHSVNFKELNNVRLGKIIADQFGTLVLLDNEDHNLALAEKLFGVGKEHKSFVSLVTDGGIGAGIIINNKIFRGIDNSFGEIGHTTINFEGPKCHCGNTGCWETYASSYALIRQVESQITPDEAAILQHYNNSSGNLTISSIVEGVKQGNEKLRKIAIKDLGKYLGIGVVNIVNTFNSELVIIHGAITELGEELKKEIEKYVKENALTVPGARIEIEFSNLGDNAHIIGAGSLLLQELFDKPEFLFND